MVHPLAEPHPNASNRITSIAVKEIQHPGIQIGEDEHRRGEPRKPQTGSSHPFAEMKQKDPTDPTPTNPHTPEIIWGEKKLTHPMPEKTAAALSRE